MKTIEEKILKHYKNSVNLREIYTGDKNIGYEKSLELRKLQDEEYKKMMFLKKLKKEMEKNVTRN